jgi:thioredoxin reductase (NADPH)
VILALGAAGTTDTIAGEQEYLGKGVSYCATCDGMLYRQATVVVAGLSPDAPEEANFLHEIGAVVHYVAPRLSPALTNSLSKGIAVHEGRLTAIVGDEQGVRQVSIAESLDSGPARDRQIRANGVFVLRPQIAPAALLPTLELSDGYISTDRAMRSSVAGVFAAGDCTGKPLQVAKAVGEGQVACLSAVEYLNRQGR